VSRWLTVALQALLARDRWIAVHLYGLVGCSIVSVFFVVAMMIRNASHRRMPPAEGIDDDEV
jgi:hypothetical protein